MRMMSSTGPKEAPTSEEILVLAPLWRDAEMIERVLGSAGLRCRSCRDMQEVQARLPEGAAALLITEEALGGENRALLQATLEAQPAWSDLPLALLLSPRTGPSHALPAVEKHLGGHNVTILGRPVPSATLVSVMRAALRARRRQYELRELLQQREHQAQSLAKRVRARTRKLQEMSERYQAARNLFFTLFQANPLPVAIARLEDGFFLDVNEAFLRYFRVTRQQVEKREAVELRAWLPLAERRQLFERLRQEGSLSNVETTMSDPRGEPKTVLLSAELLDLEDREVALVAFADITERKRAEEKIHDLASQLARAEHQERHRIAQILHDDLQQQLYSLQLQLTFLHEEASETVLRELETIEPAISDAIKMVRDLSVDLSPPILHDEGLLQGIEWIASRMREQYRLEVDVHAQHSLPVPDDGERVLLFKIVRELLFNVVKHAGVSRVDVTLQEVESHYRIDIVDQGQGFDPEQLQSDQSTATSRGLRSARQRLGLIGGRLEIASAPGQGTHATIFAPAPLGNPQDAAKDLAPASD